MSMPPRLRKFALTAHITSSVGWLGAVAAFLALAAAGLTSRDTQLARAAYLAMEMTTRAVIVPLSLAALLTGLIQSLGTEWGLFRYNWVVTKLFITVFATLLLLVHTQPIGMLAGVARETTMSSAHVSRLQIQVVADAGAALLALLVATTLSIYKPWGLTPYGRRQAAQQFLTRRLATVSTSGDAPMTDPDGTDDTRVRPNYASTPSTPWGRYVLLAMIGLVVLIVILHLSGGGFGGH